MLNSTSANYLLMSSVDSARAYLVEHGKEKLEKAYELAIYAREEIKKMGERSREFVINNFSLEVVGNKMLKRLEEIEHEIA